MPLSTITKWMAGLATAGASLLVAVTASAQSCAMCYSSAAAAKGEGIRALQHGILLLAVPPLLIFVGIFAVAFRSRNQVTGSREPELQPETKIEKDFSSSTEVFETEPLDNRSIAP